ncbi:Hsp20/alpha crystallin family protein [Epilithonimonas sp. UC225_85]|uniref:Hsp20/alpha crystallin family protein n=1 Tax=Epilithonimonas sp. UC225_85 TaxID=3350167 RepID=UPI0036D42A14
MFQQDNKTRQDHFNQKFDKCGNNFERGFGRKFKEHFMTSNHPLKEIFAQKISTHKPVNISENEDSFTLQLFAAGLDKTLFKLAVKDNVLTVSYTEKEESKDVKFIYQEFYAKSFERSFQLTEKVLADNISAAYEDGILKVTLPKNPEKNKPEQKVDVN